MCVLGVKALLPRLCSPSRTQSRLWSVSAQIVCLRFEPANSERPELGSPLIGPHGSTSANCVTWWILKKQKSVEEVCTRWKSLNTVSDCFLHWFMVEKHKDSHAVLYLTLWRSQDSCAGSWQLALCVYWCWGGGRFESMRLENWSERYAVRCWQLMHT